MKKIKFFISALIFFAFTLSGHAQNIFPQTVGNCKTTEFCLDCGDVKAGYDSVSFAQVGEKISRSYNIAGLHGQVLFQVLVDSVGNGCVISHTDKHGLQMVKDMIQYLNNCKWTPAIEKNKAIRSSIIVAFMISDGKINGSIQRINNDDMNANMSNPGKPVIYNTAYHYSNPSITNYAMTVWQKKDSELPQDMSQHNMIDKDGILWYSTLNGLTKFAVEKFTAVNENNSPFKATQDIAAMTVDADNNKWFVANESVYKYDNKQWTKYDSTKIGNKGAYDITSNDKEVLISTDRGLIIYNNGVFNKIDQKNLPQLPSNRVYRAWRDAKQRLWIGTFSGTIMVDANKKVTDFNNTDTPLKNTCITNMTTDKNGNIYFSLYAFLPSANRDRDEEGFAMLLPDGTWKHFNDKNSGLPANSINSLFYDKVENIIWIGTNGAGLVRWNLEDGWQDYHNENSLIPSSYIFDISQDTKGSLYVSTYDGMLRISK